MNTSIVRGMMAILVLMLEFVYLFSVMFAGASKDLFWVVIMLPIVVGLIFRFAIQNTFLKAVGNGLLIGGIIYIALILLYISRHPDLIQY